MLMPRNQKISKLMLTKPKEEIREKLKERLAIGRDILSQVQNCNNVNLIDDLERKVWGWRDFNSTYLDQVSNNNDLSFESSANVGSGAIWGDETVYSRLEDLKEEMPEYIHRLEVIYEKIDIIDLEEGVVSSKVDIKKSQIDLKKVFIVHGHDENLLLKVNNFLKLVDFEPIILHKQLNKGKTIIEKFEHYSDVGYAVILMSPDDLACSAQDFDDTKEEERLSLLKPRARQNVILELGFFIGKLGRDKVSIIYPKTMEHPSDINGVTYIEIDELDEWQGKLKEEIKTSLLG